MKHEWWKPATAGIVHMKHEWWKPSTAGIVHRNMNGRNQLLQV